jgi:hypothetical protein
MVVQLASAVADAQHCPGIEAPPDCRSQPSMP